MGNAVGMSVNVSVRLDDRLAERHRLRARAAGESLSDRPRRYAEEGVRRDEHPMITFRDGPTGRRAGLIGGPDVWEVWEVAMWLDDAGPAEDRAAELRLGDAPDAEIFGAAVAGGLLIALSSRFSRRPAGLKPLVDAVRAIADKQIEDRVISLEPVSR
jgi:hypothetical protein